MWDRETVIELKVGAISSGLADRIEAPLLATVAAATSRSATESHIERFSQRWCIKAQQAPPCVLEAAMVAAALHKAGRIDLAAYMGLALVRAASWHTHATNPVDEDWSDAASLVTMHAAPQPDRIFADERVRVYAQPRTA